MFGFLENPPTSINHNFLTTELILKVKDVFEIYDPESFISGILVSNFKIMIPSSINLAGGFLKNLESGNFQIFAKSVRGK